MTNVPALALLAVFTLLPVLAKAAGVNAIPNVVSFTIASSSRTSVGPASHGLAAAITTTSAVVRSGQPVVLSLEIRNVSRVNQWLYRPHEPCNYSLTVKHLESGRSATVAPLGCSDGEYSTAADGLDPGQSAFLQFRFSDPSISKPGHYQISLHSVLWYPTLDAAVSTLNIRSKPLAILVTP